VVEQYARDSEHQQEEADEQSEPFVMLYEFSFVHIVLSL
jgi:hypothetical protein